MSKTLDSDTRGFIRTTPLVMRSLRLLFSLNLVVLLVVLLKTVCGRSFAARIEKRTSRNYFARCGRGSSSSLERLSSAVPIKKILASFDVREVWFSYYIYVTRIFCYENLVRKLSLTKLQKNVAGYYGLVEHDMNAESKFYNIHFLLFSICIYKNLVIRN